MYCHCVLIWLINLEISLSTNSWTIEFQIVRAFAQRIIKAITTIHGIYEIFGKHHSYFLTFYCWQEKHNSNYYFISHYHSIKCLRCGTRSKIIIDEKTKWKFDYDNVLCAVIYRRREAKGPTRTGNKWIQLSLCVVFTGVSELIELLCVCVFRHGWLANTSKSGVLQSRFSNCIKQFQTAKKRLTKDTNVKKLSR